MRLSDKMKALVLILIYLLFINVEKSYAVYDPVSVSNNKYGIHIIDDNDLNSAAALVNSSGGDWGYVTLVITESNRNTEKWSGIFKRMERYHLIPIIRLASSLEGDTWQIPQIQQADAWADFLESLPWYTQNRYIILFNEPNHAKEWGGIINPEGYADILVAFSQKLKEKSDEFFILQAGFDASAPNSSLTRDEAGYLNHMLAYKPDLFDLIDGWTSHSYPNPHFKGKVTDTGRGSLVTYKWELEFLKSKGIYKSLPVFITETGWPHDQEAQNGSVFYSTEVVSDYITKAATIVWQDSIITAVTPFLLNYQSYPFANFSWQKLNSNKFYPQFDAYRSIAKIKGEPKMKVYPLPDTENLILVQNNKPSENNTFIKKNFDLNFTLTKLVSRIYFSFKKITGVLI